MENRSSGDSPDCNAIVINFAKFVEKRTWESLSLVANSRLAALLKKDFVTEFFGGIW